MPKLYEYFGLIAMFYANGHEPVHVHGKCQGQELRAELMVVNGAVIEIRYAATPGRPSLTGRERDYFEEVVSARADEIVARWIDLFVLHKPVRPEHITRRLK